VIVVDASAAVELVLRLPLAGAAEAEVFGADRGAHAPDLIDVESLHALRRYERRGEIAADRAREAVDDLLALPIARYPVFSLVERAWELRGRLTPYDAVYVALAEALDAPVVTVDARLAAAASGIRCVLLR
jgi:predicted nucleic acid-binding protein